MNHQKPVLSTRICIVRHGETAWNAERRIQGQLDIPLSTVGHAQARALADSLAGEHFDAAYSSDLARAWQTGEAVAQRLGLPLHPRPALRERHYGVFQGLTYAEAVVHHPRDHERLVAREVDYVVPEGGESLTALSVRALRCVEAILAEHAGGALLVFTHGGVLDVLYRRATGKTLAAPRDFDIPNTGLNRIEVTAGRWSIRTWADRGHLAEVLDELPG